MPKIKICSEEGCQNARTTDKFCRLHYLKNWRQIHEEKQLRAAKRLNSYVESICKKFPDQYLDKIKEDLKKEGAFDNFSDAAGYKDELAEVMEELGYKEEGLVDQLIAHLKVEE